MKNLRQKLLACAALGLMATPALAVPVTFGFDDFAGFTTASSVTKTEGSLGVTVTASYSFNSGSLNSTSNSNTLVTRNSNLGLGVKNSGENSGGTSWAVDGNGAYDRLTLAFTDTVVLLSAQFFHYGSNLYFTLFTDNDGDVQFEAVTTESYTSGGAATFASLEGDLFGFGATGYGPGRSQFKLTSVTVEKLNDGDGDLPTVPIPASLPLFGTGLALMAYLGMRRRKKANAA